MGIFDWLFGEKKDKKKRPSKIEGKKNEGKKKEVQNLKQTQ